MRQSAPTNIDCQVAAGVGRKTNREAGWGVGAGEVIILDQGAGKGLTGMVTWGEICISRSRSGEGHSRQRERQVQRP